MKKKQYELYDVRNKNRIFSGSDSKDMWFSLNDAKTFNELQEALYFVCCRLQNLEDKLEPLFKFYNRIRKYFGNN